MSDVKWTPGPWWVNEDSRPGMAWNREIVHGDGSNRICFMAHSDGRTPKCDRANALLIAAGPQLYAALNALVEWCGPETAGADSDLGRALADAIAALREARGTVDE